MRFPLYFSNVASIIRIEDKDTPLPPNIALASGDSKTQKYKNALRILENNNEINAVVMIESQTSDLDSIIDNLHSVSMNRRIRSKHTPANDFPLQDSFNSFSGYIRARNKSINVETPSINDTELTLSNITNFWNASIGELTSLRSIKLKESTLTYVPNYMNSIEGYINTHIDHCKIEIDYRVVECVTGSGTIIFSNHDFEIPEEESNNTAFHGLKLTGSNVTCWELTTGSKVIMRAPSKDPNMTACVHAHGVGGQIKPEKRLTIRHDIALTK